MKQYYLDSNFIIRFLLQDHQGHYKKAVHFIREVQSSDSVMVLAHFILAEVIHVLEKFYKLDREEYVPLLIDFVKSSYVICEDEGVVIDSLISYEQLPYDFPDVLLFYLARNSGSKVMSFDKDLEKIARRVS